MKKYIKIVTILLVLVFMLSFLSACSKKDMPKESLSENLLEKIISRGYIQVATEPYFPPNEFIDPTKEGESQYVGSDMELAKYIANELGVELRIIPLEFSAVLSSITEGKYDLAISALSYTPARAEAMNMSNGYHFTEGGDGHGLIIRKEDKDNIIKIEDIKNKIIVGQSGSLQELFINTQIPEYKEFKRVSATTDGFLMVQEAKADVCASYIPTAKLYIEANKNSNLMIIEGFRFTEDESTAGTRIGIPKGEEELTNKINEIIDEVTKEGLFNKWNDEYSEYAKELGL